MDTLPQQMNYISARLESMHQMIEQLDLKISQLYRDGKSTSEWEKELSLTSDYRGGQRSRTSEFLDNGQLHKDILSDHSFSEFDHRKREKELTPEIQIQRLTAQLTAAYNRIAALEEQLLLRSRYH